MDSNLKGKTDWKPGSIFTADIFTLEKQLIRLITLMQKQVALNNVPWTHEDLAQCLGYGYNHICDQ